MEYPIDIFDNHVILIDKDKRLLIDTGAPISISDGSSIDVFNNVYSTKKTYHGANIPPLPDANKFEIFKNYLNSDICEAINQLN